MESTNSSLFSTCIGIACVFGLGACAQTTTLSDASSQPTAKPYELIYRLKIEPDQQSATASIHVSSESRTLRELQFTIDPSRHTEFDGDGELTTENNRLVWQPPPRGG
ncbi:MAG: hypothetical protein ACKVJN_11435, partial [Woeseiales bacterium]